jgi:Flp pilus assembly protein TadG
MGCRKRGKSICSAGRFLSYECGTAGQSTVEFAIVFAAFLCVAIGLGALWHLSDSGLLVQHALQSASHHLGSGDIGAWGDVLAY